MKLANQPADEPMTFITTTTGHQLHELGPFRSLVEILVFEKAVLELKVLFLALAPLLVVKIDIRALDNTCGQRQQIQPNPISTR